MLQFSASRINGLRQQKLWISTAAADSSVFDAFEGGGTISSTDYVMASCRWVVGGGHDGWNEMHATRDVQRIDKVDVSTGLAAGICTPKTSHDLTYMACAASQSCSNRVGLT